jgi:hypothetical protein
VRGVMTRAVLNHAPRAGWNPSPSLRGRRAWPRARMGWNSQAGKQFTEACTLEIRRSGARHLKAGRKFCGGRRHRIAIQHEKLSMIPHEAARVIGDTQGPEAFASSKIAGDPAHNIEF